MGTRTQSLEPWGPRDQTGSGRSCPSECQADRQGRGWTGQHRGRGCVSSTAPLLQEACRARGPRRAVAPALHGPSRCSGRGPGAHASCPCPPSTRPLGSRNRCLLSVACSQGLCWTWPPVLGTRGPQNPPQQGQARVPCGLVQPRPLLPGLGDSSRSASPPTSAVEGSRAGPERGAPQQCAEPLLSRVSPGPIAGRDWLGGRRARRR